MILEHLNLPQRPSPLPLPCHLCAPPHRARTALQHGLPCRFRGPTDSALPSAPRGGRRQGGAHSVFTESLICSIPHQYYVCEAERVKWLMTLLHFSFVNWWHISPTIRALGNLNWFPRLSYHILLWCLVNTSLTLEFTGRGQIQRNRKHIP